MKVRENKKKRGKIQKRRDIVVATKEYSISNY